MTRVASPCLFVLAFSSLTLVAGCGPDGEEPSACDGILAGDLVITEIFADHDAPAGSSGADDGKEWFEITNVTARAVDLGGLRIVHSRPDGSRENVHVMSATTIAPGQYLVLGNVTSETKPAYVDYGYGPGLGDFYNSDGGRLALQCGATPVDEALYNLVSAGLSTQLDGGAAPDYTLNDDFANWCEADPAMSTEFDPGNFGTPQAVNQDCVVITPGTCNDGGTSRPTVPPQIGDLVITEVMPSPAGDDNVQEWFEVLVNADVDLNGVGLDRAGDSAMPKVLSDEACLAVTAGTYLVFARSSDSAVNGGLTSVFGTFAFSMVAGSATSIGDVQLVYGLEVLDAVTWTRSGSGTSLQLDAAITDAAGNDAEANWCDGSGSYGAGGQGTPGLQNAACGGGPADGMCLDADGVTMRAIVAPTMGQVSIREWMPDPALVGDSSGEWFEVRTSVDVDLNGMQAGAASLGATPIVPSSGNCVRVLANTEALFARLAITENNGMLPPVDGTFGFDLVNGGGTLQVGFGGVTFDTVTWAEPPNNTAKSYIRDSDDTVCLAPAGTTSYNGTDVGTPRASNTPECP